MNPDYETVRNQALKLPDDEKSRLVVELEGSFSEEYLAEIQQSWAEEIVCRRKRLESGEIATITLEEFQTTLNSVTGAKEF